MAESVELFFDDEAEHAVRKLWRRLDDAGLSGGPRDRPRVTLASARTIPKGARDAVREELRYVSLPDVWLYTLGTFPGEEPNLVFAAVVDTELLAVHSAVHDALAGRVSQASAYYFPGAWVPHCVLTQGIPSTGVAEAFELLRDTAPVRARTHGIAVTTSSDDPDWLTL
ncbi:2'-5' RNA ligase family protein [Allosaccharopolyspora coralli]|uniref:2'-5' RNA ligase family protein n=1 Tax=Allosaccharopolyspora coralli TaxID=2665642 RepID=A0A5Q3QCA8_9PSEU|nr:2'-5' RNA ligase family protein [Allosaccharopolyspora coralli]QGK68437.1 2'-5' RNA ligase family protein [Allosaccharopolyspora coralli]